jgi:hypothetical protein
MRAALDSDLLKVDPGSSAAVTVEVANTAEVIDGVGARIIGVDEQYVSTSPTLLPLFPDARGTLTINLDVPQWFPAGRRQVAVEVQSHGARTPSVYLDLNLDVSARPALHVGATPKMIRSRRSARFVLQLTNAGNVPLEVSLRAADADRSCQHRFSQDTVRIEAGTTVALFLTVRCPRLIAGGEIGRSVTVEATSRRLDLSEDDPARDDDVNGSRSLALQVQQRPLISRGLMTALVLAGIVALWAGAFLLGIAKVFASDPLTKEAPESFFVKAEGADANFAGDGLPSNGAPAGAVPKDGQVPAGVGGQITGTVYARSDRRPVGRILVQAVRLKDGQPLVVSSAATQTDGTYTLAGLFPMDYFVKFSATGFNPVWYPAAPSWSKGRVVSAAAQRTTTGIDAVIAGKPATISGTVRQSGALTNAVTTVTAYPLVGAGKPTTAQTNGKGAYVLRNLRAPETYELTFKVKGNVGYRVSALTDSVSGGEKRTEPQVTLGAGTGKITGTVTDGTAAIGGATVSTTVNGKALTVLTPTTGRVGSFELDNLVTPATYVVTFSAPGHGTISKTYALKAGASRAGVAVKLTAGTGSIDGVVRDSAGNDLGDVSIVVGGATTASGDPPTTTTYTKDPVGHFTINGLAVPGSYTITASLEGYGSATTPIKFEQDGSAAKVTITLSRNVGTIGGEIHPAAGHRCATAGCGGDTVTATDGVKVWNVTVTDTGYSITGLHFGSYSVTVTDPVLGQQTALVTVTAEDPGARQSFRLGT